MNPKQIRILFFMSVLELVCLYGCVMFSYMQKGNAPLAAGIAGLVLMVCSFTGSVYGMFEMRNFKENHNRFGMAGTVLHVLIFLILLILYAVGMIL